MNTETTNLIERPYQEIVDDILTAIVGGVVNEPIIFDVKSVLYKLAEPAAAVRSITGLIDTGAPEPDRHTFQNQIDFQFNADKNAVVWQDNGQKPKDETQFYVDYFRPTSRSPLTDINVGSVTRTLGEAIGREIATLYQQVNLAYKSGFIDLAEGKALDFVVSILGVTRKTKEFAVGLVTFFRKPGRDGNITIGQGTEIATTKGDVIFETTEPRTLQRGQGRIDVPIRAGEKFKGDVGKVDAGQITSLFQIIDGIDRVNNFEPTFLAAEDETDKELRLRAKAALQSLSKGTIAALLRVAEENRVKNDPVISDPNSPLNKNDPGKVSMVVEIEPAGFPGLVAALNDVRAAGVQLTVTPLFVFVTPRIVASIKPGLTGEGNAKVKAEIIAALKKYFEDLKTGESADGKKMLETVRKVSDVKKEGTQIADVRTLKTDVENSNADPLVEALVTSLSEVSPSDTQGLRNAITSVIDAKAKVLVPSAAGIPDRSLVQSKSGGRAPDGDIAAGEFLIVPPETFSLVLEMEPTDIILRES